MESRHILYLITLIYYCYIYIALYTCRSYVFYYMAYIIIQVDRASMYFIQLIVFNPTQNVMRSIQLHTLGSIPVTCTSRVHLQNFLL